MSIRRLISTFKLYYVGLSALCCVGVAYVCGVAVSRQTQENEVARSGVHLSPGKVNIGTRTSAYHPVTTTQPNTTVVPMISGNTVRGLARGGHAASSKTVSLGTVRATSITPVRTTKVAAGGNGGGGGGGGGGDATLYTSSRRRSNTSAPGAGGIGAIPMPSMAMVSRSYVSESGAMGEASLADETLSGKTIMSGKKDGSTPGDPGTPGDPVGPVIPVGNTPWVLMLLLAAGYGLVRFWLGRSRNMVP